MIPTFETQRLILKNISLNDVLSYEKHFIDYEVVRNLSSRVPWPYPAGGIADFIQNQILARQGQNRWFWGIYLKTHPAEIIGGIEFWKPASPENRGFWLGRKYWNQGLMSEATTAVMDYAFDQLEFETLIFSNALGNIGSRRIKEKTGATFLRNEPASFVDPTLTQRELWELTKKNWKNRKKS
ncbi:MAG: GNAT family N-acetyltransferase [Bdellovibrionaceae bacterium]|nr:GNAT family N-acetyltransferase [Pseudobdellovibrionaceae bacterium]